MRFKRKQYKCSTCKLDFARESALANHKKLSHAQNSPVKKINSGDHAKVVPAAKEVKSKGNIPTKKRAQVQALKMKLKKGQNLLVRSKMLAIDKRGPVRKLKRHVKSAKVKSNLTAQLKERTKNRIFERGQHKAGRNTIRENNKKENTTDNELSLVQKRSQEQKEIQFNAALQFGFPSVSEMFFGKSGSQRGNRKEERRMVLAVERMEVPEKMWFVIEEMERQVSTAGRLNKQSTSTLVNKSVISTRSSKRKRIDYADLSVRNTSSKRVKLDKVSANNEVNKNSNSAIVKIAEFDQQSQRSTASSGRGTSGNVDNEKTTLKITQPVGESRTGRKIKIPRKYLDDDFESSNTNVKKQMSKDKDSESVSSSDNRSKEYSKNKKSEYMPMRLNRKSSVGTADMTDVASSEVSSINVSSVMMDSSSTHQQGSQGYWCETCSRGFSRLAALEKHKRSSHRQKSHAKATAAAATAIKMKAFKLQLRKIQIPDRHLKREKENRRELRSPDMTDRFSYLGGESESKVKRTPKMRTIERFRSPQSKQVKKSVKERLGSKLLLSSPFTRPDGWGQPQLGEFNQENQMRDQGIETAADESTKFGIFNGLTDDLKFESIKCVFCSERFPDVFTVNLHIQSCPFRQISNKIVEQSRDENKIEPEIAVVNDEDIGYKFSCEYCFKVYATKDKLKEHQNTNCPRFGAVNPEHKSVINVVRRESSVPKFWRCQTCFKKFGSRSGLKWHEQLHLKDRRYPCELCGLGFGDNGELARHRLEHRWDAEFNCFLCPSARFLDTQHLLQHEHSTHFSHSSQLKHVHSANNFSTLKITGKTSLVSEKWPLDVVDVDPIVEDYVARKWREIAC